MELIEELISKRKYLYKREQIEDIIICSIENKCSRGQVIRKILVNLMKEERKMAKIKIKILNKGDSVISVTEKMD